jgi:hypothetical protein
MINSEEVIGTRGILPHALGPWIRARCRLLAARPIIAVLLCLGTIDGDAAAEDLHYRIEYLGTRGAKQLRNLTRYQMTILEKLNRADSKHLARLGAVVFPDRWLPDELAYSPLPLHDSWAAQHPKAIIIDQPLQAFGAYENGRLVRWGPVSTGRRDRATPSGLFHLNWKSTGRHSTVNPRWYMPWYFNFDNRRGLSMHAYDLPGYPASHACVRLLETDAKWLFSWGEPATVAADGQTILQAGTPVMIVGQYDFNAPAPWRAPHFLTHPQSAR